MSPNARNDGKAKYWIEKIYKRKKVYFGCNIGTKLGEKFETTV